MNDYGLPKTRVVNVNFHEYDVFIGRATSGRRSHVIDGADGFFGNPVGIVGRKDDALRRIESLRDFLRLFRHRMGLVWNAKWSAQKFESRDREFIDRVHGLRGKTLGCMCKPALCHGDIYVAYLEDGPMGLARFEALLDEHEAKIR